MSKWLLDGQLGAGDGFYNPHRTNVNVVGEHALTWMGFPRDVMAPNRDSRAFAFQVADTTPMRGAQNEYCEWRVERNGAGKITKVTIVTEAPEYWQTLWSVDPARVLALYQTLVSPLVTLADLGGAGPYSAANRWNTTDGIVHFIVGENTI